MSKVITTFSPVNTAAGALKISIENYDSSGSSQTREFPFEEISPIDETIEDDANILTLSKVDLKAFDRDTYVRGAVRAGSTGLINARLKMLLDRGAGDGDEPLFYGPIDVGSISGTEKEKGTKLSAFSIIKEMRDVSVELLKMVIDGTFVYGRTNGSQTAGATTINVENLFSSTALANGSLYQRQIANGIVKGTRIRFANDLTNEYTVVTGGTTSITITPALKTTAPDHTNIQSAGYLFDEGTELMTTTTEANEIGATAIKVIGGAFKWTDMISFVYGYDLYSITDYQPVDGGGYEITLDHPLGYHMDSGVNVYRWNRYVKVADIIAALMTLSEIASSEITVNRWAFRLESDSTDYTFDDLICSFDNLFYKPYHHTNGVTSAPTADSWYARHEGQDEAAGILRDIIKAFVLYAEVKLTTASELKLTIQHRNNPDADEITIPNRMETETGSDWLKINNQFEVTFPVDQTSPLQTTPVLPGLEAKKFTLESCFGHGDFENTTQYPDLWKNNYRLKLLKETESSPSWATQTSGTSEALRAVRFIDTMNGWAVGDAGTVLRTFDGGATWSAVTVDASVNFIYVQFISLLVGFVGGSDGYGGDHVYRTTNGGYTWTLIDDGVSGYPLLDARFYDADHGVILTTDDTDIYGYITANGGGSWNAITIVGPNGILDCRNTTYVSASVVFTIIGSSTGDAYLFYSADGGASFSDTTDFETPGMNGFFLDEDHLWTFDGWNIFRKIDSGGDWEPFTAFASGQEGLPCHIAFSDALNGFAIDSAGNNGFTDDGGETWSSSGLTLTGLPNGVFMLDANHIWIVSASGYIKAYTTAITESVEEIDKYWYLRTTVAETWVSSDFFYYCQAFAFAELFRDRLGMKTEQYASVAGTVDGDTLVETLALMKTISSVREIGGDAVKFYIRRISRDVINNETTIERVAVI